MQCFYVGAASDRSQAVTMALAQAFEGRTVVQPDLARLRADATLAAASAALVVVAADAAGHPGPSAVVDFAREYGEAAFTVYLADAMAPDDYKRLVRTGCAEWIAWSSWPDELRELAARLDPPATPSRSAKVMGFLPSKGGVGATTLLAEMAVELSQRRRTGRIAILDLNVHGGTVAEALDLEPRLDIMEILDRPERLDEQLVDIFRSSHSKSLDVFASPHRPIAPDAVKPDIVFTVVDAIASRYDTVFLDLPSHPTAWTENLLRGSDAVIACGGGSVPALRRLTATLDHLDGLGLARDKIGTVVNDLATDWLGRMARRQQIGRILGKRRVFFVRRDDRRVGHALDIGRPVLQDAPGSPIGKDLQRLAAWLAPMASIPQPGPTKAVRWRRVAA